MAKAVEVQKVESYVINAKYEPDFLVFITAKQQGHSGTIEAANLVTHPRVKMQFSSSLSALIGVSVSTLDMELMFHKKA